MTKRVFRSSNMSVFDVSSSTLFQNLVLVSMYIPLGLMMNILAVGIPTLMYETLSVDLFPNPA